MTADAPLLLGAVRVRSHVIHPGWEASAWLRPHVPEETLGFFDPVRADPCRHPHCMPYEEAVRWKAELERAYRSPGELFELVIYELRK